MAEIKKWYNTNFSKSVVLNGKETFHFWVENKTADTGVPRDLYMVVIPDIPDRDPGLINDPDEATTFLNGADFRETCRVLKDYTEGGITDWTRKLAPTDELNLFRPTGNRGALGEIPLMSIPGEHRYGDATLFTTNIANNSNEFYTLLIPPITGITVNTDHPDFKTNVWNVINPDARMNFRVDYNGKTDDNVKLTLIISNKLPGDDWPVLSLHDFGDPSPAATDWANRVDGDVVVYIDSNAPTDVVQMYHRITDAPNYEEMVSGEWLNQEYYEAPTKEGGLMGIKLLHAYGQFNTFNSFSTVIDYQESNIQCYTELSSKTSRDVDYWMDKKLHDDPIICDSTSYALTRTNPKISGNIKIVTDSTGEIFLESIDANEELSNVKFKRQKIAANGDYANDLKTVFGTVEPSSLFQVFEADKEYLNTKRKFIEQYDFFYGAGASLEASKLYEEEFSIFAPIWIRKKLPEYFVIFKNDNPINTSTYTSLTAKNNTDVIIESLGNASIVKTFDLRPGTKLGTYLNNIVTDDRFRESPISVNYNNTELTTWFGASYVDGTVAYKGSYMYDYYKEDNPIIVFENEITSGFENNGIISLNLINLDFKFNDEKSPEYSINRYFGLYLNAIELATFQLYTKGLEEIEDQIPAPRIGIDGLPYSSTTYIVENADGVLLPIDYINDSGSDTIPEKNNLLSGRLPILSDLTDNMRFFYVSDSDSQFDRVTDLVRTETDTEKFDSIRISTNEKNLQKYGGISNLILKNKAILQTKHAAFIKIDFSNDGEFTTVLQNSEEFEIKLADYIPGQDTWKMIANPTGLNPGQAWNYPVYDISKTEWVNTFSPEGTPTQVATSFSKCLNNFTESLFTAFSVNESVYIGFYSTGSVNNDIQFTRYMVDASVIDNVKYFGLNKNIDDIFTYGPTVPAIATGNVKFELTVDTAILSDYKVIITNKEFLRVEVSRKDRDNSDYILYKGTLTLNSDGLYEISHPDFIITFLDNIDNYNVDDEWTYIVQETFIEQNFIGGNDINKNSAVIIEENIINITARTYFQAAKDDYSTVKNWNVQGEELLYIDNVNFETLEVEDNVIIYLTDLTKQFYVSDDDNITGFNTFTPSFGIFSILPFKEFDTDLILSSYAYGPYDELLKYYGNIDLKRNESILLGLNNNYIINEGRGNLFGIDEFGDETVLNNKINFPFKETNLISVEDNPNTSNSLLFNTFSPSREYDIYTYKLNANVTDVNNTGYTYYPHMMGGATNKYIDFKFTADRDTKISNFAYFNDKDLKDFEGFFILQDIIHESDIDALTLLKENNDISRFTLTAIASEYERLREISTKELATISKVVPYINKWVMKNKDVRDNPYRLNNSLAFGMTNFSPLLDNNQIDPKLHSHEFFYIDSFPKDFDPDIIANHRLYFYDKLDKVVYDNKSWLELMQTDITSDWFSKYFTLGYPTEQYDENPVSMGSQQRFGLTEKIPNIDIIQTIFHGAKIQLESQEDLNDEYSGYKISAIMKLVKPELYSSEPPINFEIITNKINKTILIVGTLRITDYKIASGIDYTFMYASKSSLRTSNMIDYSKGAGVWDEQVYVGDPITWGADWGAYTNRYDNDDSDQIYAAGFSSDIMNEYQIGAGVIEFADVKLNCVADMKTEKLNLAQGSKEYNLLSTNKYPFIPKEEIKPINGSLYDLRTQYTIYDGTYNWDYNSLIETFNKGGYSDITQQYKDQSYINPTNQIYSIKNMRNSYFIVTDSNKLFVYNQPYDLPETSRSIGVVDSISGYPTGNKYNLQASFEIDDNVNAWYIQGGELFNASILSKFSFGSMVDLIHDNSSLVTYTTLGGDEINPILKFIENDTILKTNKLLPILDVDKPAIYKNKSVVGFNYESKRVTDVLYRHRGEFEPKTRTLMYNWVRENETMTTAYNVDFLGMNTKLLPHDNFGISKNMYFNKVADNEILKIASATGTASSYKSLYRYIDEIAIDYDHFSLFKTTWDAAYFKKYDTVKSYEEIDGINILTEFKSFYGSKAMNVPNNIYIEIFEESDFKEIAVDEPLNPITLDTKKSIKTTLANTIRRDTTGTLLIDVDVTNRIIDIMIAGGAPTEFKKLIEYGIIAETDIEKLTREYLTKNIIKLYYIEDIKLYVKNYAKKDIEEIFVYDLSDYDKQFNGYTYDRNATIQTVTELRSKITRNLESENYQSFSISINVRRI